jgi:hypothetical protein
MDEDYIKKYWTDVVKHKDDKFQFRIENTCYVHDPSNNKGFGGIVFRIVMLETSETVCYNLWYLGVIPENYRTELPDNAKFYGT